MYYLGNFFVIPGLGHHQSQDMGLAKTAGIWDPGIAITTANSVLRTFLIMYMKAFVFEYYNDNH